MKKRPEVILCTRPNHGGAIVDHRGVGDVSAPRHPRGRPHSAEGSAPNTPGDPSAGSTPAMYDAISAPVLNRLTKLRPIWAAGESGAK